MSVFDWSRSTPGWRLRPISSGTKLKPTRNGDATSRRAAVQEEQPEARRFYAEMLLERAERGDRERAEALLDEAIVGYRELGYRRHVEMAEALLQRL